MTGIRRREFIRSAALVPAALALAKLEKDIAKSMHEHKIPGLSMALIKDAKLTWNRGFGVHPNAVFEAASMSKPVFAYAVMKACEKGILSLDTPLVKYTRQRFLEGDPKLDRITARHVLSHTTGFQEIRSGQEPLKIHFTPGEKWRYSGEGYFYLQSVLTELTGRVNPSDCSRFEADLPVCATDFNAYMTANLLAPFGMKHSAYLWTDAIARNAARPHDADGKPLPHRKPTPAAVARYGAMGGLLTTATDYAKFLIQVMHPTAAKFQLSEASRTEMLRPQIKVEDGDGYSIWWALGWRVAKTANGDLISHGGDQPGFHSTSEISLKSKTGYVILTNGENGWKLIRDLAPGISSWVHESGDSRSVQ